VSVDSEFTFELAMCAWAERNWPPGGQAEGPVIVARQLGTKRRRWDTIVIECDPAGIRQRATFGERRLDSDLLDVIPHAPPEWTWYRDALPDPGYPWQYVREAIHRAADRGILETRKRGNKIQIRRIAPYPDWVERIVAIENKPDIDASAARDLAPQLHRDVAIGLADEVWVASAATGATVEPILLEDLPVEAGVLTLDVAAGEADATWQPRRLAVDAPGTRILENPEPGAHSTTAARFDYADADWKGTKRLEIAERAYERGWRAFAETMRPDCRHFQLRHRHHGVVPYCAAKERVPTASECAGSCPEFEPEPPAWRAKEYPIDGGPGKGIKRLLDRQRRRQRPELE
jgi:hypothetical protein